MSKKLKLVLIISLISNLIFIGIISGYVIKKQMHPRHSFDAYIHNIENSLPQEKAHSFRTAMNNAREKNHENKQKMNKLRQELTEILAAKEFDAKLYQNKVDEINSVRIQFMNNMSGAIQSVVQDFTQEERAAIAEHLHKKGRKHKRKR